MILAFGGSEAPSSVASEKLGSMIDALNTDTEMVLVAVQSGTQALTPIIWSKAAYLVELPADISDAEGLRTVLQDVLNRGRDTALVTSLSSQDLITSETAHRMLARYCEAGDDTWAVLLRDEVSASPMLLGRRMIELFLRDTQRRTTKELLAANRNHLLIVEPRDAHSVAAVQESK